MEQRKALPVGHVKGERMIVEIEFDAGVFLGEQCHIATGFYQCVTGKRDGGNLRIVSFGIMGSGVAQCTQTVRTVP